MGRESNAVGEIQVHTVAEVGWAVRQRRKATRVRQTDVAGVANVGERFVVELEQGKATVQLGKALQVLDILGFDVILRPRAAR